jgi:lytic murein transglycosylase
MMMKLLACVVLLVFIAGPARAADPAFDRFLQSMWPEAQKLGVSRPTFDAATRGLEPDLSLPDLALPGRADTAPKQPEFVQTPADYVRESSIARLAAQGKKLLDTHRATLDAIERQFGVQPSVLLAIWGRETAYGGYKLPHDALRVLATQAYTGRRKDLFRGEFLAALKMLQDGVPREKMRSSWGGAMGLTQFLPSEFYKHAVDFDGDGKVDIWTSIPDALASAAKQLANKGWQRGERWAYEVRVPAGVDCTIAQPGHVMLIGEWLKRGYAPAYGRKLAAEELKNDASLLLPEGAYGPAFLAPKNYFVIKDYNFSDLYVLFVGHLSDRILDARPFETPWSKNTQLRSDQVEAMQRTLTARGLYADKVDGKAGMLTRAALGAYQKTNGLKLDCWPTAEVLAHMQKNK